MRDCLDRSDWPVTVSQVLDNARRFTRTVYGFGRDGAVGEPMRAGNDLILAIPETPFLWRQAVPRELSCPPEPAPFRGSDRGPPTATLTCVLLASWPAEAGLLEAVAQTWLPDCDVATAFVSSEDPRQRFKALRKPSKGSSAGSPPLSVAGLETSFDSPRGDEIQEGGAPSRGARQG